MFEYSEMEISEGDFHLHVIKMDTELNSVSKKYISNFLSKQELEKWQRYRFKKDQDNYLVTRAFLRSQLSNYLGGQDPLSWEFITNKYGKPYVANNYTSKSIFFNISHSGGYVICAFSMHNNLGIDLEFINEDINIDDVAPQYFSSREVEVLFDVPTKQRVDRFYEYWTMKEAFIKAIGLGLSMPLNDFYIEFCKNDDAKVTIDSRYIASKQNWHLKRLNNFVNCKAAICVEVNKFNQDRIFIDVFSSSLDF